MPFKLQGSSMMVIQPCYDGRLLPITHQVAADGLALLSIKDSHHNCTLTRDPGSKQSSLSCTKGIKPRNSFWNLHKPELRKVKGLDCTTMDSVVNRFQSHNIEDRGALAYTKRVVSKLGSVINKKSKPTKPQVLIQNVSWPINCCILSSICQETEIESSEIWRSGEAEKTIIKRHDFEQSNFTSVDCEEGKDTVFITLPSSNMHENTSDDFIPINKVLNSSSGDSFTKTSLPFNSGNHVASQAFNMPGTSQPVITSSILLENKQSQHQISIPSNVGFYKENMGRENISLLATGKANMFINNNEKSQPEKKKTVVASNVGHQGEGSTMRTEIPSSVAVQSIFSDIFRDIEDIKIFINSYMSSFYVHEEEYNNFPKRHTPKQEIASHFYEQFHGTKNTSCDPKKAHCKFLENTQNDFCPELSSLESVGGVSAQGIEDQDKNTLQGNTKDPNKKETSIYCYWEDNDLEGEFTNDKLAEKMENSSIQERNSNRALVTHEFIESLWEEFVRQVETHALFIDLVNENKLHKIGHENEFPTYGHWANMYDPNIFQEAENIVHTLDSLMMGGCFPDDEGNTAAYIPCTIVELVDGREFIPEYIPDKPCENEERPNLREGYVNIEQDCETNQWDGGEDHTEKRNTNFVPNETPASEIINKKIVREIKLEPVVYQEKLVQSEIDYFRVPEYERIPVNFINNEGNVELTPKECFLETSSQLKHTAEKNYMETLKKEEDKDDSDQTISMFGRIQERNGSENSNPAFIFSSPTVQLNLTRPYVNTHKK